MSLPLFVDFEARSRFDIDGGGRGYAQHPTTQIICGVLEWDSGGSRHVYRCDEPAAPPPLPKPLICCAHNAVNFDRFIWSKLGWPEPDYWIDTDEWARLGGLPRVGLDALAVRFLGRHKDLEGSKLMTRLRRWSKKTDDYQYPLAPDMERVISYCSQDVADLEGIYPFLLPFAGNDLPGVRDTSLAVNDRGFHFDQDLAWTTLAADSILSEYAIAASGFPAEVISSPPQLRAAFESLGVPLADVQADTIKPLLAHPDARVRSLAMARKAATSITSGKLRAALGAVSPDSRLRDQFRYHKAHTGRWAGRQFQPHNLAKGKKLKNLDEQVAKFKAGDINGLG